MAKAILPPFRAKGAVLRIPPDFLMEIFPLSRGGNPFVGKADISPSRGISLRKCFGRSKPLPYGASGANPYGEYKFG